MACMISSPMPCISFFLLLLLQLTHSAIVPKAKTTNHEHMPNTYIIHTDHLSKPPRFATLHQWYTSMVASPANASRIIYTYDTVMHGFAAELTEDEARRMSITPGVSGVYQDRLVNLQTTRSPGFLGLESGFGLWPDGDFGDGVIVGIIDTGIWPESLSFNDSGLGPVRKDWKGKCDDGERFSSSMCNNKLVGAKSFTSTVQLGGSHIGFASARDSFGHGTHVASTAAGSEVSDAQLFGFARQTARGVAPKAKIAMYKACLFSSCFVIDIVKAIEEAVKDGVDIISMSIGDPPPPNYYDDTMSVAFFGAMRRGIFVACAAGNSGPRESTVENVAPWITTVGAASIDRVFPVRLTLGNGEVLEGESLYDMPANQTGMLRLLNSNCGLDDLVPDKIMGKIAVCTGLIDVRYGFAVERAGGSGLVALNPMEWDDTILVWAYTLPAVTLGYTTAYKLMAYVNSSPYPTGSFSFTCETVIGENRAPVVTAFSSRGPSRVVPEILKPDVVAPGLNILAAWPDESSLSFTDLDPRRASFNIISGTSMACPHVAGIAALLKGAHRSWTPAMIRSALMTTASVLDNESRSISDDGANRTATTPLAAGAGHVRPQQALDPGLVYDTTVQDYVDLMCTLNYTVEQLRRFVPGLVNCTRKLPGGPGDLNYPSFVVVFDNHTYARTLTRTVTKVSELPETYNARVVAPSRVAMAVTPASLEFKKKNESKSYTVEFRNLAMGLNATKQFGSIIWESEAHQVRSPVVFIWENQCNDAHA